MTAAPRTAAGRRLVHYMEGNDLWHGDEFPLHILAIEAEAAALDVEPLRKALERVGAVAGVVYDTTDLMADALVAITQEARAALAADREDDA